MIYVFLVFCAIARAGSIDLRRRIKSLRICRLAVLVRRDLCAPPSRRIGSLRKINEKGKAGLEGRAT